MEHSLIEELSEEVRCSICLELFNDPRQLICGHTFCFSCLEDLFRNESRLDCPVCRLVHELDRKGVQGLSKNRYVANVVNRIKEASVPLSQVPLQYALYSNQQAPLNFQIKESNQDSSFYPPINSNIVSSSLPSNSIPTPSSSPLKVDYNELNYIRSAPPLEDLLDPNYQARLKNQSSIDSSFKNSVQQQIPERNTPNSNVSENSNVFGSVIGSLWNLFVGNTKNEENYSPNIQALFAPYTIEKSQIRYIMHNWIKSLWFPPTNFLSNLSMGKINAIYVPFWIFNASSKSIYSADICRYQRSSESKKNIEIWSSENGTQNSFHQELFICADTSVSREVFDILLKFSDWDKNKALLPEPCKPQEDINPPKLDKFLDMKVAWDILSKKIEIDEKENCLKKCKKQHNTEIVEKLNFKIEFSNVSSRLIFLPAFLCNYFYESEEYIFIVSGQTGSVNGQRPYGLGKLGEIGNFLFGKKY